MTKGNNNGPSCTHTAEIVLIFSTIKPKKRKEKTPQKALTKKYGKTWKPLKKRKTQKWDLQDRKLSTIFQDHMQFDHDYFFHYGIAYCWFFSSFYFTLSFTTRRIPFKLRLLFFSHRSVLSCSSISILLFFIFSSYISLLRQNISSSYDSFLFFFMTIRISFKLRLLLLHPFSYMFVYIYFLSSYFFFLYPPSNPPFFHYIFQLYYP